MVPAVGSDATLDIACWNVEFFPKADGTVELLASVITSLDLDVVVIEEIASEAAWTELVARLPEHEAILSSHRYSPTEYQKIGILYRAGAATLSDDALLFTTESYDFPRPPLAATLTWDDGVHAPMSLRLIGLHLKAGVAPEDGARRTAAVVALEGHVRGLVEAGTDQVVVLGDWNEVTTDQFGQAVLAPFLAAPERYTWRTAALAAAGVDTFLPAGVMLDHIMTTAGLADELGDRDAIIPPLDEQIRGYDPNLSDHLPVVLSIPLAPR